MGRSGSGMKSSTASMSSMILGVHSGSPSRALSALTRMTGTSSPGKLVLREQLAYLELDEVEELLVVDHVGLVERHHDGGHAHLTGEQHVLTGLGHGAVGGGDDEDGTVDLGRAGDHVLDVVGVAGHVDVRVVALVGLVLDVGDRDGDAALLLLGGLVDLVERGERHVRVLLRQDLGDGRRERGLAVVDVSHRPDVDVRLRALELLLGHDCCSGSLSPAAPPRAPPRLSCVVVAPCCVAVRAVAVLPGRPWCERRYSPRARATISRAIESGTSWYALNCMVYVARPWVRERRSVA